MKKEIIYSKTVINDTAKIKAESEKDKYTTIVEQLFIKLQEVGDTATFEVDNVNSFKTAYYRLRGHRNHSVKMKKKLFLIRDAQTLKPIKTGESRSGKIQMILIEDRNKPMRRITLAEQFPDMTEEQIQAMLNRREE